MAAFGLAGNLALLRLATVVHHLDVGGEPVPEAAGFEAVMTGARANLAVDDAPLAEMSGVLDSLFAYFRQSPIPGKA